MHIYNNYETNHYNLNFTDRPSNVNKQQFWADDPGNRDQWVRSIRRVVWAPFGGGIFGQDLGDTINYEKRIHTNHGKTAGNSICDSKNVPKIVENCCEFLKNHGIQEEGIFRMPGDSNKVKALVEEYDMGMKFHFDPRVHDIHTVASLLKYYVRELPKPLIPCKHFVDMLQSSEVLAGFIYKREPVENSKISKVSGKYSASKDIGPAKK